MEKISRILPSSPRVASADMRNSGVARSGMPSFGRPQGVSALATPRFDGMARATEELKDFKAEREPTLNKNPKAEIVERLSRDFFSVKPKEDTGVDISAEIVARFHDGDSDLNPLTGRSAAAAEELAEDTPVVGGQLDVMA
jgi:hypothetical protein